MSITVKDSKDGKDGRDGKDGKDGIDGIDGIDGKDGYILSLISSARAGFSLCLDQEG